MKDRHELAEELEAAADAMFFADCYEAHLMREAAKALRTPDLIGELVAALAWYGEQARLARLIHSEGDAGRQALASDGGERARALIAKANEGANRHDG